MGFKVEDKICFDLYGCVQVCIDPGITKEGKLGESFWFDVSRLKFLSKKPIKKTYHKTA